MARATFANVVVLMLAGCASDPATFHAADTHSYDAVKDAFRAREVDAKCVAIGTVEGKRVDDLAITAARHGGTHFIVSDEKSGVIGHSKTTAGPFTNDDLDAKQARAITARVHRCP